MSNQKLNTKLRGSPLPIREIEARKFIAMEGEGEVGTGNTGC